MELLMFKTFIAFFPPFTLFFAVLLLVGFCYLINSNIKSCCFTTDARHPRVCMRKRDMTKKSHLFPFVLIIPFLSLMSLKWLIRPVLGPYCSWNSHFNKVKSFWNGFIYAKLSYRENMVKRVCPDCLIPNCGAKYFVKLSNYLTDVHQLDYVQRRKWL